MFNVDPKLVQKITPLIQRVLILDHTAGAARILTELLKSMGSRDIMLVPQYKRALSVVDAFDPQLIITEFRGPDLDGLEFTKQLRRSDMHARQAPVIMITAEATATSIIGARNAGVHEFLRKPFTAGDLYRRIENVVLKPRPWIEAVAYVGPDRRRFNSGEFEGTKKRKSDKSKPAPAEMLKAS